MNAFFTAVGRHFQKRASRLPWGSVLQNLRQQHLLPEVVPHIPFIEPEPVQPIGPAIPDEVLLQAVLEQNKKDVPAPELQPELKPEGGEPGND